jgi:hypothetical protein
MTTPNIVSDKYVGQPYPPLVCKIDCEGSVTNEPFTVTIPNATAATTLVALTFFRRGAEVSNLKLRVPASLGAGTFNVGVAYYDNVNNTNNTSLFASGVNATTTGAVVFTPSQAADTFRATGDGFICVEFATGPTTAAGTMYGQAHLNYDQP